MVNLPVYALEDLQSYNYSNTSPKDTHVCTTLSDGRTNCIDQHYQCDQSTFNMTSRQSYCLHYNTISSREICTDLPIEQRGCLVIGMNDTIPPMRTNLETRPMNMSHSTVSGTPTPTFQNTTIIKSDNSMKNQIMINRDHFSPSSIQVAPGSTITWTNNDTMPHRVRSGMPQGGYLIFDGIIDSGIIQPGQSFQIVENDVGTIRFYTTLHNFITGSVSNAELQDFMSGIVSITNTPVLEKQNTTLANSTSITSNLIQNATALNQTFNSGPTWVKKIFSWYESGRLSETELFSFVKWMIDNKIMGR